MLPSPSQRWLPLSARHWTIEETGRLMAPQPHESIPGGCPGLVEDRSTAPQAGPDSPVDPPIGRMLHRNSKGLDLPIAGEPEHRIETASPAHQVALLAADYPGMSPTMHVQVGDEVSRGQLLFEDKKTSGVRYTSPGSGRVTVHSPGRATRPSVPGRSTGRLRVERPRRQRQLQRLYRATPRFPRQDRSPGTAARIRPLDGLAGSALRQGWPTRPKRPRSIFVTGHGQQPSRSSCPPGAGRTGGCLRAGIAGRGQAHPRDRSSFARVLKAGSLFRPTPSFAGKSSEGPILRGTVGFHIHMLDPVDRKSPGLALELPGRGGDRKTLR